MCHNSHHELWLLFEYLIHRHGVIVIDNSNSKDYMFQVIVTGNFKNEVVVLMIDK